MPSINFSTKNYTTTVNCTRGDTVFLTVTNIPTKSGLPYQWTWNIRPLTSPDPKTGTISQSNTGTLATATTTSLAIKFDLPGANYALNTKHSFGLQLVDPDTNDIVEGSQIILAITADSVDDAGQQIINDVNPSNFVRSVVLTGLSLVTGGAISATDTILQAFGKLQNQISNISVDLVWGAITGNLSDQTDLQNALNVKVSKSGDTMAGKLTVRNEVEINNSSIVGDNNGIIQKVDNVSNKGAFRWLFNNVSSFPVIMSAFRNASNELDYVEFSGRVKGTAPTENNDLTNKNYVDLLVATLVTIASTQTITGAKTFTSAVSTMNTGFIAGSNNDVFQEALAVNRNNIKTGRIDNNASGLRVQALTNTLFLRNSNNLGILINPSNQVTFDAGINLLNPRITQITTPVQTFTPAGTAQTIDWNNGSVININLGSATGNVTLTLNNAIAGTTYLIKVTQGATARNLIFPAGTLQVGGGGNTHLGVANETDLISVLFDGGYVISAARNIS
jgi:hypothetical protein